MAGRLDNLEELTMPESQSRPAGDNSQDDPDVYKDGDFEPPETTSPNPDDDPADGDASDGEPA